MGYVLSCCSTVDLSKEHLDEINVSYICFHYSLDGKDYPDDLGQTMPFDEFYKKMTDGADTKTSQVSVGEYEEYFKKFLDEGNDILHVCLSSGLSGTYRSAVTASSLLREQYPDRKIYVVDSLCASSGYGLFMDTLAQKRDHGMSVDELHAWAYKQRLFLHHWFFSTDLTFYVKGGRVSKMSGIIGGIFEICPLLNMDKDGKLTPRAKIRSKKKVITEIVKRMEQHAQGGLQYDGKCYISQSACYDDAREVADLVEEKFRNLDGKVVINSIGTTIGSHTGPGTIALFFWGDRRDD